MQRSMSAWLALGLGAVMAVAGGIWIVQLQMSGAQPWSPLLADNVLFAKSLPFVIGLGILMGLAQFLGHASSAPERRGDKVRRFAVGTSLAHWTNALGFLIALSTGAVQYLKGVLDVPSPVPLDLLYRLHYVGATLIVLAVTWWLTYHLLLGDRRLLPDMRSFAREVRGLAAELPGVLGGTLAGFFGVSTRRPPPPVGQFTYYERLVSFPVWAVLIGLIVVTGIVKAMRYVVPIPGEVINVASIVHVATMVLIAAKLLDHLRYVLSPSRWPLLVSMATTWVGARYARERHPGWDIGQEEAEAAPAAERGTTGEAVRGTLR